MSISERVFADHSNKPYTQIVDHPHSFGQPGAEVWASIWEYIEPLTKSAMSGTPVYREDDLVIYKKYAGDHDLETYFNWSYVPISRIDGVIIGFYNQASDATDKCLAERRLGTIRAMSEQLPITRSTAEYYDSVADVFDQNPFDSPFVLCYSVAEQKNADSGVTTVTATLERTVGVPDGHASAIPHVHFDITKRARFGLSGHTVDRLSSPTLSAISTMSSGSGRHYVTAGGASWPIQKALTTRQCVIVEDCRDLIAGYSIRSWEELPFAAVVVPISGDGSSDMPESVLVMGLNSRRPLDADYDAWLQVIRSQLASSLVSVKAHEAEQRLHDDMMKMERAKSAWFQGAAHDLRSPLTLINGPVEDLLNTELKPAQRHSLHVAKRNIDRLLRLVNTLMDFSRLEAGRVVAKFVPIEFASWVADVAELFRAPAERMGITYKIETVQRDRSVFVDPALFENIVSNLIGNALKYTAEGEIAVKISFTDCAEVSVHDTGVGIPENEIPHVTDWYNRASTAYTSGVAGTGLGLALVKELLRLHDGDLTITSKVATPDNPGHGSVFTARVPIVGREAVTDESTTKFGSYGRSLAKEALGWAKQRNPGTEASSEAGGSESHVGSSSNAGSITKTIDTLLFEPDDVILLVDDNSDMREYIRNIFKRYCKVYEASDGEKALEMVDEFKPDLIISDVMMPKMNGLELLTELRNRPATKITPVVLLSAMQGVEARVDALMMGAEDYIEKPFKPRELLARVHLHLHVGKKRAKLEQEFAEREARIALLSDYCPSGIMGADENGIITYGNAAWKSMAGMSQEEDVRNWPQYVTPQTIREILDPWEKFVVGDERELRISWKWLSGIIVNAVFIRLDLVKDGMTGILGCIADVTHEVEKLRDAEERRREAEESKHQQELLIDLTSHEIRTPVSAILQCSSLVKENLIALKDQLRWSASAGHGFKASPELLDDLNEDVDALDSESSAEYDHDTDHRHLSMWSRARTYCRGCVVSSTHPARYAQFARRRNRFQKRGQEDIVSLCI